VEPGDLDGGSNTSSFGIDDAKQSGIVGAVVNWMTHPFNSNGSALNWILFVGLLIVAAGLWNTILLSIKE
jgi:hypothetical protein